MTSHPSNTLKALVWRIWSHLKHPKILLLIQRSTSRHSTYCPPDKRPGQVAEPPFLGVCIHTLSPHLRLLDTFHFTITHLKPVKLNPVSGFHSDRCLEQLLKMSQRVCINLLFPHTLHFKVFRQQQKTIKGNSELRLKHTICFQAEGHKTSVNHCRDYILPLSGIERLQNNVISNY